MAVVTKTQVKYNHEFDRKTKRHTINGVQSVLHCHHYTSLYTQLALDAGETALIQECGRESFRTVLDTYYKNNPELTSLYEKVDIACQYFGILGLGQMQIRFLGEESGEVELTASHTDAGWMKKWGKYDKPINYISAGYIEAMFESVLDLPAKSFDVIETQSIVMGADTSIFKVTRR